LPATNVPIAAAITRDGPQVFNTSQSTAPFLLCEETERSEVITMVAIEVATQTCINWSPP
jgi:hypothetical protein